MRAIGYVLVALVATSCVATETSSETRRPVQEETPVDTEKHGPAEIFGARLSRGVEVVSLDDLIADPEGHAGRTLETEGVVRMNCQKRGCWMEVRSLGDAASESVTVRFVDYGFFVPLDSRGTIVRVQGSIAVDALSKEEVDDLLSEGHDPGIVGPDGTARVVTFTASGVEMWNRNQ